MRYLKRFNESGKESVEHQIDASYILDLMQEIIDEYCLDDYRRITRADGSSNHGWFLLLQFHRY